MTVRIDLIYSKSFRAYHDILRLDIVEGDSEQTRERCKLFHIPWTQSKEPSSTCLLRPSTCNMITDTPGLYTPLPPLDPADVVSTKVTPNMGVGFFAIRDVNAYDVIFSERPLLVLPWGFPHKMFASVSDEEVIRQFQLSSEELLQTILGTMTKEDVDTFMGLCNSLPNDPLLHGIARTNAFSTGADIEEENLPEGKFAYWVIGRLTSRINHRYMVVSSLFPNEN